VLRRAKHTADAVSCDSLYSIAGRDQSPFLDGFAPAQDLSIFLVTAGRLIDERPPCEATISRQGLIGKQFLTAEVGGQGKCTAPFITVCVLLGDYLLGR
jgi:hypothetical protein